MLSRRNLLASAAAGALAGALKAAPATRTGGSDPAFETLLGKTGDALLTEHPENATFLGLDSGAHAGLKARLTDRSGAAEAARATACGERLRALKAFDASKLGAQDAITLEVLIEGHQLADDGYRFPYGDNDVLNVWQGESNSPYIVNHNGSAFATIPDFLDNIHKIANAADAEAYLARLSGFAHGLDAETERMRRDVAAGIVPPDFLIDLALKQERAFAGTPSGQATLVTSVAHRTAEQHIAGDWQARATRLYEREVLPAVGRQIAGLEAARRTATADAGSWKLPQGDAYYDWALRNGTTTTMSPDEVHRLGIDQVRAIGAEMDTLLRKQGLTQGTPGARMTALNKDPKFLFPDSDAGRAALLAYLNGVIASVRTKLPHAFSTLRKADLVIKRVPVSIEAGAPDGYEQDGPLDGSRPATYYINLRDMGNWPKFSLPTLCFHEGLPGHVWQGAFAKDLPPIRSMLMFNAYVEGWALYAEQLGEELGMYADDPFGRLGYLQSTQFRAVRLVVDTGIHAKRWTRDQAIQWMVENNGNPYDAARGEIDRYCAWPGQACGYMVGKLHIVGLQQKARTAMGAKFDERRFNDAVVQAGAVPLTLLDRVIDGFIARG